MDREKFDESIVKELIDNGFSFSQDWAFGPVSSWSHQDHYSLRLMKHHFGYWLIISQHFGGENKKVNLGSSNNAKDIIAVRDVLRRLW